MIDRLADLLRRAKLEPDEAGLADAVWLAQFLPPAPSSPNDVTPPLGAAARERSPTVPAAAPVPSVMSPAPAPRRDTVGVIRPSEAALYVRPSTTRQEATVRAREIHVPAATALPGALAIGRALRPFGRRYLSRQVRDFDEAMTVRRSADSGFIDLAYRPARERWFKLMLLVDDTPSMTVWTQTLGELEQLLAQHGAFADVRRWSVRTENDSLVLSDAAGNVRRARELRDPAARRLVVVASDCVSPPWHDGRMAALLRSCATITPTAVLQMLPERLWRHTSIGSPSVRLHAHAPGQSNRQLSAIPLDDYERLRSSDLALPVIYLDDSALVRWARMVMGLGTDVVGTMVPALPEPEEGGGIPSRSPAVDLAADGRLRRFRSMVSPEAYRLAVYLSAVPLSLPVMQLVHGVVIPNPQQWQLAEVLLGGIVTRDPSDGGSNSLGFEFLPGVRELLQVSIRHDDLLDVLARISRYLEARLGRSIDFAALLADPDGDQLLPAAALPFATFGAAALRHFEYKKSSRTMPVSPPSPAEAAPATVNNELVFAPGLSIGRTLQIPRGAKQLAWSPDGRFLAVVTDRTVMTLTVDSGTVAPELTSAMPDASSEPLVIVSYTHQDTLAALAVLDALQRGIETLRGSAIRVVSFDDIWVGGPDKARAGQAAAAFAGASAYIAFITPAFQANDSFRRDVEFAVRALEDSQNTVAVVLGGLHLVKTAYTIDMRGNGQSISAQSNEAGTSSAITPAGPSGVGAEELERVVAALVQKRHGAGRGSDDVPARDIPFDSSFRYERVAWSPDSDEIATVVWSSAREIAGIEFLGTALRGARSFGAEMDGARGTIRFAGTLRRVDEVAWRRFLVSGAPIDELACSLPNGGVVLLAGEQSLPSFPTDDTGVGRDLNGGPHIAWSPDHLTLGAAVRTGVVKLLVEGTHFESVRTERGDEFERSMPLWSPFTWSGDGRWFATWGDHSWTIAVWDPSTRTVIKELTTDGVVREIAFSHDSGFIAAETGTRAACVWRTGSWELATQTARQLSAEERRPLAFSPGTSTVAVVEGTDLHLLRPDAKTLGGRQELDAALIFACDRYPQIATAFDGAEAAAQRFAQWVVDRGGVPQEHVMLRLGPAATGSALAAAWHFLSESGMTPAAGLPSGDRPAVSPIRRAYIYFAGMAARGGMAGPGATPGVEWLPVDFFNQQADSEITDPPTGSQAIRTFAKGMAETVVISDCRADPELRRPLSIRHLPDAPINDKIVMIAKALQDPAPIGLLTDSVISALSGEAADAKGSVTASALGRTVRAGFLRRVSTRTDRSLVQEPSIGMADPNLVVTVVKPRQLIVRPHPIYVGLLLSVRSTSGPHVAVRIATAGAMELPTYDPDLRVTVDEVGAGFDVAVDAERVEVSTPWSLGAIRVLVLGSVRSRLTDLESEPAQALGRLLPQAGLRLVSGGSAGVDELVVLTCLQLLRASHALEPGAITLVRAWLGAAVAAAVRPGEADWIDTRSNEGDGNSARVSTGDDRAEQTDEQIEAVLGLADAVILIGGGSEGRRIAQTALGRGKIVIPLPGTGGAAQSLYDEARNVLELRWPASLRESLARSRDSQADAAVVAAEVVRFLRNMNSIVAPPRSREFPA